MPPRPALLRFRRRGAALAVGLFLLAGAGFVPAVLLWCLGNILLALGVGGWGLFQLRSVFQAREVALRWAFWLAVAATFAVWSALEANSFWPEPLPAEGLFQSFILVLFPIELVVFLILGFLGAAFGVFVSRAEPRARAAATSGVRAWWFTSLAAALGTILATEILQTGGESWTFALWTGLPGGTLTLALLARDPQRAPQRRIQRALDQALSRVVWRRPGRRGVRVVDGRGLALGTIAAVATGLLGGLGWIAPLRSGALAGILRVRSALQWTPLMNLRFHVGADAPDPLSDGIVLLELDGPSYRAMVESRSEAAVQAEVIRLLDSWGARAVVLPQPLLGARRAVGRWHPADQPGPTAASVARTRHDLPKLIRAVADAGMVYLMLPAGLPVRDLGGEPGWLADQARAAGPAELPPFRTRRLPAIPLTPAAPGPRLELQRPADGDRLRLPPPGGRLVGRRSAPPPPPHSLALQLWAGLGNRGERWVDAALPALLRETPAPQVAPGLVLVEFAGSTPGTAFRNLPYGAILRREAVFEPDLRGGDGSEAAGRWTPAERFWPGKVVFLDTLLPERRETPIGTMRQTELLAHALHTLQTGRALRRLDTWWWALAILAAGIATGQLSYRRDPLDGAWRVALIGVLILMTAILAAAQQVWFDPVGPVLASTTALILVTQFSFQAERDERARNRTLLSRFVAPQILEELLDDPGRKLGLGGELQQVCVLFADARGFSAYAETHTPHEVIEVTNAYLSAMTDALFRYGGILDKYLGDGMMAFFRARPGDAEVVVRAVQAALSMGEAAQAVSRQLTARGKDPLGVGIGVHLGPAIVGLIGNPARWDYTALGYTVVACHRLQGIADGGQVLVSDSVQAALGDAFLLEKRDAVAVKGLSAPISAYRVLGPTPCPSAQPDHAEAGG